MSEVKFGEPYSRVDLGIETVQPIRIERAVYRGHIELWSQNVNQWTVRLSV